MVLKRAAARRRELAALALREGWSYCQRPDPALAARLSSFLVTSPHAEYGCFSEVVTGTVAGWAFASFRYTSSVRTAQADPSFGAGGGTDSFSRWVTLLRGLRASQPPVSCWPRSRQYARILFQPGDYPEGFQTGNHAFDDAFYLDGPADLLAGGLGAQVGALMPGLVASLGRDFSWQVAARTLRTTDESLRHNPGDLPLLLTSLATVADLLQRHGLGTKAGTGRAVI